jgi:ubiquinone/menaquinone biosynthesis C-methylase UbiE
MSARVVGVDLSPNSIAIARQKSQQYTNIDFQVADILKCKFPVEEFDAIELKNLEVKNFKFRSQNTFNFDDSISIEVVTIN